MNQGRRVGERLFKPNVVLTGFLGFACVGRAKRAQASVVPTLIETAALSQFFPSLPARVSTNCSRPKMPRLSEQANLLGS